MRLLTSSPTTKMRIAESLLPESSSGKIRQMRATTALLTMCVTCAAAVSGNPSPGDTLFSAGEVSRFKIQIAANELDKLRRDNRTYVRATVSVGTNTLENVGIRLKGHGSFRPLDDRPHLTLKFNQFSSGQKV